MTDKTGMPRSSQKLAKYRQPKVKLENEDRRFKALPTVSRTGPEGLFKYPWIVSDISRAYSFFPTKESLDYQGNALLFSDGGGMIEIIYPPGMMDIRSEPPREEMFKPRMSFVSYDELRDRGRSYKLFDSYKEVYLYLKGYYWWMYQTEIMEIPDPQPLTGNKDLSLPVQQIEDYLQLSN